jgi:hypothetical protein
MLSGPLFRRLSVFILLSLLGYAVAWACGFTEDECDSYVSFALPQAAPVQKVEALYYTPESQFYSCWVSEEPDTAAANEREWAQYAGLSPQEAGTLGDISTFIEDVSTDTLKLFYTALEKKTPDAARYVSGNALAQWFRQQRDLEALGYILYARQCQAVSAAARDAWDVPVVDSVLCKRLLKNGRQLYAAAKKPFIRERYALQLIKTAFYAGRYKELEELYKTHYLPVQGELSSVDVRITGYRSGAWYRSGRKAEAAYAFAQLFDRTDDPSQAYSHTLGFVWSWAEERRTEVLRLCKNDHEKATVLALAAMRSLAVGDTAALQAVYALEPSHPFLEPILIRELNKIEEDYLHMRLEMERGFGIYNSYYAEPGVPLDREMTEEWIIRHTGTGAQLQAMANYLQARAAEGKMRQPALWLGAAAYLHQMRGDYVLADVLLREARAMPGSNETRAQLQILQLTSNIMQANKVTPATEAQWLEDLQWLESFTRVNKPWHKAYRNILRAVLPMAYARSGDSVRMVQVYRKYEQEPQYLWDNGEETVEAPRHFRNLYFSGSGQLMDRYFTQQQLEAMIRFNTGASTSYERWLLKGNWHTEAIIRELMAVKHFRALNFEAARKVLQPGAEQVLVPDPFVAHIRDLQEGYFEDTLRSLSLEQLLDTLQVLQQTALVNLQSAFDYGCALYSLSYHGKCHGAWTFFREYSAVEPYYESAGYNAFEREYFQAARARTLFEGVANQSTDTRLKQRALWMLAKCEQKRCGLQRPDFLGWGGQEDLDYVHWNVTKNPALQRFHREAAGTPFYDSVFQECSYLRLFAARK